MVTFWPILARTRASSSSVARPCSAGMMLSSGFVTAGWLAGRAIRDQTGALDFFAPEQRVERFCGIDLERARAVCDARLGFLLRPRPACGMFRGCDYSGRNQARKLGIVDSCQI